MLHCGVWQIVSLGAWDKLSECIRQLVYSLTRCLWGNHVPHQGSKKLYNLNLPFGQASLKFHLPGQDFINCYFSLVHEQLVHIFAHRASEWGKSLVRHKNLLVPDWTGLFSSPAHGSMEANTMFQYKIIHNILATKVSLCRAKICDSNICPLCLTDIHSLDHMFLRCSFTLAF